MPEASPQIDINEAAPPTLNHIIGQSRAVQQLRIALEAHYTDRAEMTGGEPPALPHILLVGPPGVGKSLLAKIIAKELGVELHEALAQNIYSPYHLHGLMMMAEAGDCVFVDEIHELNSMAQTTLYRALEERRLFLPTAPGEERKELSLPSFTFCGATTDEWTLTKPLRDRFKLILRLDYYTDEELTQLVAQRSRRLGWSISDAAIKGIAARGRGTPRLALRLLEATRRVARAEGASTVTIEHFRRMCEVDGIDSIGLDPLEQRFLQLLKDADGRPVRLNVLATRLGLPRQTIERVIEHDLIRLGLINKSDVGRTLTPDGHQHVSRLQQ